MTFRTSQTVVLAAGGTGGHIFPAEALAEELLKQGITPVLMTDSRFGGYAGMFEKIEVRMIRAGRAGKGVLGKLRGVLDVGVGVLQARKQLKELAPLAVVGFGGYPSFPTVFAASQLGIPTVIHEQNAVLGRANRVLAGRVKAIATSFPTTGFLPPEYFPKTTVTGNPVRAAIRALREVPYPELSQDGTMRLLVMGGSQGASVFSEVMPAAMEALPASLRARIRIDQQCREADIEATRAAYAALGMSVDLATFFTDVPARLASAHLVITRAGASTVAELAAASRPAILVPLPSAMDDHQTINANALEENGAGWLIPQEAFTPAAVSARIEGFLNLPANLSKAAASARTIGRINAAQDLAKLVLSVGEGRTRKNKPEGEEAVVRSFAA